MLFINPGPSDAEIPLSQISVAQRKPSAGMSARGHRVRSAQADSRAIEVSLQISRRHPAVIARGWDLTASKDTPVVQCNGGPN